SSTTQSTILTFEDARHLIEQHAANLRPHGRELLDLLGANGRALAEPITADRDFPPFRRATRDGYAVRASDHSAVPATLEVVAEAKAGGAVVPPIVSGKAGSVTLWAPGPGGRDARVSVEWT